MMTDDEWDLEKSKEIEKQYKQIGREYMIGFTTDYYELHSIKDVSTELLISEFNFRKKQMNYLLVNDKICEILNNEILYRRKQKINKIQKNILKNQNFFVYLYNLLKKRNINTNVKNNSYI